MNLTSITLHFPQSERELFHSLAIFFSPLTGHHAGSISFSASGKNFLPLLQLNCPDPQEDFAATFQLNDNQSHLIKIKNTTGITRHHSGSYAPVSMQQVIQRLNENNIQLCSVDHLGFNLPWFSGGTHPEIIKLRESIASACLYHTFPGGEPWDFILPGSSAEISGNTTVDYSVIRKPKFELVSFDGCSRPLLQFDLTVNATYPALQRLFPEALMESALEKCWIYLQTQSEVDVCLVVGPDYEGDWSEFFSRTRFFNN